MTQPPENNAKQTVAKGSAVESNTKADSKLDKNRGRKNNTFLLIIIILILAFIVTFGSIFMFNFAGLKAETSMWISNIPVVGKLLKPVVENKNPEQIAKEEVEIEKSNNAIKLKEINEQKKELDKKAKEIESKERELAEKELQINDTLEKLSEKLTSIQEQVQYLEKVDNTKAMNIIMSMDDKVTAVQILRNMKKEKASAILALMDPLQAAQILEDIAEQPLVQDVAEETEKP
ncbi:MAG TPA: hypothetical protein VEB00_08510 [Clostridia bacterium]|nr:hypothetical protein [Clostridia bacterium]